MRHRAPSRRSSGDWTRSLAARLEGAEGAEGTGLTGGNGGTEISPSVRVQSFVLSFFVLRSRRGTHVLTRDRAGLSKSPQYQRGARVAVTTACLRESPSPTSPEKSSPQQSRSTASWDRACWSLSISGACNTSFQPEGCRS